MTKVSTNLGKVATTPKGEYNSATTYLRLDVVTYNGSSYVCLKESVGNLPTNTEYWQLMASKGDTGAKGQDGHTPVKGVDYFTQEDIASLNIPEKTSDLTNDSGFITNTVNNLINYYLKSETYTKTEVNTLIGNIQQFHYEVVQTLPTTGENNILYLVPKTTSQTNNVYDEYVYSNGWEKIGDTEIDLSNYVTITMLNQTLADYTTTANLTTLLNAKQDLLIAGDNITIQNNVISASGGTQVFYQENSLSVRFDLETSELGFYVFQGVYDAFCYKYKTFQAGISHFIPMQFLYTKKFEEADVNDEIGILIGISNRYAFNNGLLGVTSIIKETESRITSSAIYPLLRGDAKLLTNDSQNITGEKVFSTIPKQNDTNAPTNNAQFTNKKYVDDQIATKQDILTAGTNITIDANNVISATGGGSLDKNSIMLTYYIDYNDRTTEEIQLKDMHDKALDGYKVCAYINVNGSFAPTILYPINVTQALMVLSGYEYRNDSDVRYGVDYGTIRKHTINVTFANGEIYNLNVQYVNNCYVLKNNAQILGTSNTVSYTPVNQYNPATKKYVDDAIGGALGGSY